MENIYQEYPISIRLVNPFNNNVLNNFKVEGGRSVDANLQTTDFSILDQDTSEIIKKTNINKVDECVHNGCPEFVMMTPFTNIEELKNKIYIATGIHSYRQHIILIHNTGIILSCYNIKINNEIVETNIFNSMQNITDNQILNIPVDIDMVNNKNDIIINMNDIEISVQSGKTYVTKVILCDMYNILNPKDQNVREIISSSNYQKDILYYGFILKFFPSLPYAGFDEIYINNSSISYMYPYLSPAFNSLKETFLLQKKTFKNLYGNIKKSIKYYKSSTKRTEYYIHSATIFIKIPDIDIRNFFDMFLINNTYVYACYKTVVNGRVFFIDKRYFLYNTPINIYTNKIQNESILILTDSNEKIYVNSNNILVEVKFDEQDNINFDNIKNISKNIVEYLIKYINKLGIIVLKTQDSINLKTISYSIINTVITLNWNDNYTSEQFSQLGEYLNNLVDINFIRMIPTAQTGVYVFKLTCGQCEVLETKKYSLLQQFPNITNQYDYYINTEFRQRFQDLNQLSIQIQQKISHTSLLFSGFCESTFEQVRYIFMSFLYLFGKQLKKVPTIKEKDSKLNKKLKKLSGIDPILYNIKKHDKKYQVYSIKCQSERQPDIYKKHEIAYLSKNIKDRLFKFWNYTEQSPIYYSCPSKKYPHLSFRPQDHPLGYCLPCCKKLIPSADSRQSKIDEACYQKYILPHNEIDDIIKNLDKESSHLLAYGKDIGIGRVSKIPTIIENKILLEKTSYRLVGVEQNLPNYEHGGFIFSILHILNIDINTFVKELTSFITPHIMEILDYSSLLGIENSDHLKDCLSSVLIGTDTSHNIHCVNLINIISQLVSFIFNVQLLLLIDSDNDLSIRILNSAQSCLMIESCKNNFGIICSHDNGEYPLIELPNKRVFDDNNKIVTAMRKIIIMKNKNDITLGIDLIDILEIITKNSKYKVTILLRGKRGLIYAVIINDNIYIPCIYSEYFNSMYKYSVEFPNINKFKRSKIYEFIDVYNKYILKKYPKDNTKLIDPQLLISYKEKYIGFKVIYDNNKYGLTFYHSPEQVKGRYSNLETISFKFDIVDINNSISKPTSHNINPNIDIYLYKNYVYNLFLIEFGLHVRKSKDVKIRNNLIKLFQNKMIDRRDLRNILIDYPGDYTILLNLLLLYTSKKILNMLPSILFGFDLKILSKLKAMNKKERLEYIKNMMKPNMNIVSNITSGISNLLVACQSDIDLKQCTKGKLNITKELFNKCCEFLASDIDIPYIYETIVSDISQIRDKMLFTKRPNEILHIKEI